MISPGTSSSSSLCVSFSFLCNGISILLIITRLYVLSSTSLFVPYTYHSSSLLHCISQLITTSPFITLCPTYSPIPIYGVTSSTTFSKSFTRSIVFTMLSWSLRTYSKKQYILQYINCFGSFCVYYSSTPNKPVLYRISCSSRKRSGLLPSLRNEC